MILIVSVTCSVASVRSVSALLNDSICSTAVSSFSLCPKAGRQQASSHNTIHQFFHRNTDVFIQPPKSAAWR